MNNDSDGASLAVVVTEWRKVDSRSSNASAERPERRVDGGADRQPPSTPMAAMRRPRRHGTRGSAGRRRRIRVALRVDEEDGDSRVVSGTATRRLSWIKYTIMMMISRFQQKKRTFQYSTLFFLNT